MRNIELVQYSEAEVIDEVIDGLWPVIKAGAGREDCRPGVSQFEHVVEMDGVVRCLAGHKNQPATLFQANVCGPVNKVCPGTGGTRIR